MSKSPGDTSAGSLLDLSPRPHAGNGTRKLLPARRGEINAYQIDLPSMPGGQDARLDSNKAARAQRVNRAAGSGGGDPGALSRATYRGQAKWRSCQCCENQRLTTGQLGDVRGLTQLQTQGLKLLQGEPNTSTRAFGRLDTSPQ